MTHFKACVLLVWHPAVAENTDTSAIELVFPGVNQQQHNKKPLHHFCGGGIFWEIILISAK